MKGRIMGTKMKHAETIVQELRHLTIKGGRLWGDAVCEIEAVQHDAWNAAMDAADDVLASNGYGKSGSSRSGILALKRPPPVDEKTTTRLKDAAYWQAEYVRRFGDATTLFPEFIESIQCDTVDTCAAALAADYEAKSNSNVYARIQSVRSVTLPAEPPVDEERVAQLEDVVAAAQSLFNKALNARRPNDGYPGTPAAELLHFWRDRLADAKAGKR